ncbi:MAG: 23S rRNA (guanosine(2251)-2'-O)-methyltransferase RlmB [Acidimicrobiales bacterium]
MSGPKKRPSRASTPRAAAGPAKGRGGPKGAGPKGAGPKSAGPKGAGPKSAGPKGGAPKGAAPRSGPPRGGAKAGRRPGPPVVRSADRGLDGTQVEGRHAVRELLLAGTRRTKEVLIAEAMDPAEILDDIVELAHDLKVPVREISKRRLDAESKTEASQGVVARAEALREQSLTDLATTVPGKPTPFLVAVDGVTDPGNLGAIIRTAECAGVTGLLLPRHRAVHVTPTVTKAAAGAVEHVPMTLVGGLPTAIEEMRKLGVWVVGLDAGGEKSLHEVELGHEPVCLVLGAEGEGLSRLVRQRCDQIVSIPLLGSLSSLNVSTAAALAIYEVVRRRAQGRP